MSVGAWAMALSITTRCVLGCADPTAARSTRRRYLPVNPMIGSFRTSDGRCINLTMLQPGRYFADVCKHLGLEHLLEDERFATAEGLMANADEVGQHIADAIAEQAVLVLGRAPRARWKGQWAPVQDPLELADDPQLDANGYLLPRHRRRGQPSDSSSPARCSSTRRLRTCTRAPQFAEHTDDILRELGKDEDEIIQLKLDGACT